MKIAFLSNHLSLRGTEVAMYDYAHFNETLLNNKSIIITRPYEFVKCSIDATPESYKKFSDRFEIFYYSHIDDIDSILESQKCDILYVIKGGENEGLMSKKIKTIIHCVFNMSRPHGDLYLSVSPYISKKFNNKFECLPHMINLPNISDNLREKLNIPSDAIVFGRHGGFTTFDVKFVHRTIEKIVDNHLNIYFIFMHTNNFCKDKKKRHNLIFLESSTDVTYKTKFINTCDAFIHARMHGETFGLVCGEFAMKNKYIITYTNVLDKAHLDIMKDNCLKYSSENELYEILTNFKIMSLKIDVLQNGYKLFTPEYVIDIFNNFCKRLV